MDPRSIEASSVTRSERGGVFCLSTAGLVFLIFRQCCHAVFMHGGHPQAFSSKIPALTRKQAPFALIENELPCMHLVNFHN
jgi:hypothetical protein